MFWNIQDGHHPIILTERKEHSDLLTGLIKDKCDNNNIVREILSSEETINCEFIMYDNAFQNFAVIDRRIVWYGNINFLSYNYSEESAIRFINESVAGKLSDQYN